MVDTGGFYDGKTLAAGKSSQRINHMPRVKDLVKETEIIYQPWNKYRGVKIPDLACFAERKNIKEDFLWRLIQ